MKISLNSSIHITLTAITDNNATITNPYEIANSFNNYLENMLYLFNISSDFPKKIIISSGY